ncbi:MAG: flagellar export chaperone FlgN [Spirochaetales bacterium]|nr:flagellar export chaperone FlgN [Spirochaetales bacterium]
MQHDIIAKKIRENLTAQKQRLDAYLTILDHESADIADKDADKLQSHVKMESRIVSELNAFKKVLGPLEDMYQHSDGQGDESLDDLRSCVMSITHKVQEKSDENKRMLDETLVQMQNRIDTLPKRNISKNDYSRIDSRFIDITL